MCVKKNLTDAILGTMFCVSCCALLATPCLMAASDDESDALIGLDVYRSDPAFAGIDGSGYVMVIIDDGFDVAHPDLDNRIVFTRSYGNTGGMAPAGASSRDDQGTARSRRCARCPTRTPKS